MRVDGVSREDMADRLGCTRETVQQYLRTLGLYDLSREGHVRKAAEKVTS